jgi:hypothetical protein
MKKKSEEEEKKVKYMSKNLKMNLFLIMIFNEFVVAEYWIQKYRLAQSTRVCRGIVIFTLVIRVYLIAIMYK